MRANPGLHYRRVPGLRACGCTTMVSVLSWMIVCAIGSVCLRKREKARAKLKTSSFAHLYMPKVYFDFTICPFSLHVIVVVEHI